MAMRGQRRSGLRIASRLFGTGLMAIVILFPSACGGNSADEADTVEVAAYFEVSHFSGNGERLVGDRLDAFEEEVQRCAGRSNTTCRISAFLLRGDRTGVDRLAEIKGFAIEADWSQRKRSTVSQALIAKVSEEYKRELDEVVGTTNQQGCISFLAPIRNSLDLARQHKTIAIVAGSGLATCNDMRLTNDSGQVLDEADVINMLKSSLGDEQRDDHDLTVRFASFGQSYVEKGSPLSTAQREVLRSAWLMIATHYNFKLLEPTLN